MEIELTSIESRALGAFIEKELTTPDYYPMSLNALTNACNQKSNRNPVLQLSEADVQQSIDSLRKKGLAMQSQDAGSRVVKFRHTLRERLHLDEHELAILAELLLRGPQTPGELRSRADRMARFEDLHKVDAVLQELIDREPSLAAKLSRQPGRKEHRFTQLLGGNDGRSENTDPAADTEVHQQSLSYSELATQISELQNQLTELKAEFERFKKQFE